MGEMTGSSQGFGFVCFEDPKAAVKAASELHTEEKLAESKDEIRPLAKIEEEVK